MNPFKVGDRIRCIDSDEGNWMKIGEEYIVTCVEDDFINFTPFYPTHLYNFNDFILLERAEDIAFDKQLKDIVNESF